MTEPQTATDLRAHIQRRQRTSDTLLVPDYEAMSPTAHVAEPIVRQSVLESLFDYLDPIFDWELPSNAYIWGPAGAGKSAIITALFTQLQTQFSQLASIVDTTTRSATSGETAPAFVAVDARNATTEFALCHAILDGIVDEPVPKRGVGIDAIRTQLQEAITPTSRSAVVVIDHVGEPETYPLSTAATTLEDIGPSLSWIAVGRSDPTTLDAPLPSTCIEIPAYREQTLVDIVSSRATDGLAETDIRPEQIREIADWADGNAHDALAALFGAADRAATRHHSAISDADLTDAILDVPRQSVSLGRVCLLPPNRQRVLYALITGSDRSSVESATDAIVDADTVELSAGTVKRFLYELADTGIIERIRTRESTDSHGRPPSRLEARFPAQVFQRLYRRSRPSASGSDGTFRFP